MNKLLAFLEKWLLTVHTYSQSCLNRHRINREMAYTIIFVQDSTMKHHINCHIHYVQSVDGLSSFDCTPYEEYVYVTSIVPWLSGPLHFVSGEELICRSEWVSETGGNPLDRWGWKIAFVDLTRTPSFIIRLTSLPLFYPSSYVDYCRWMLLEKKTKLNFRLCFSLTAAPLVVVLFFNHWHTKGPTIQC